MLKIDNTLLVEIGLDSLPEAEKNSFLKHIYETLEMRVGVRLADQMTNEQLDEFERYFEAKDDAGAFKWLETNFPNYKDIVQQEFDKLKSEVAQSAPQIMAASQAAQAQQPQPQYARHSNNFHCALLAQAVSYPV
jgi:Tfp pilus assembly protein PilE